MFVAHDVDLGVPFVTAQPRLTELISGRTLVSASQIAYDEGLARLAPAWPSSARLMRVRSLQSADVADRVTAGLRWEASGVSADPYPVLDADLTLAPVGHSRSRLALAGVYRAPFGYLNELDAATTGHVATATIRALLRAIADYLAGYGAGWAAASQTAHTL